MKQYPHIAQWNKGLFGEPVFAFDKLDGSNIRVEYVRKLSKKSAFTFGFNKFGSRTQLINKMSDTFGPAVDIFYEKYAESLDKIFLSDKDLRNINKITVYLEYYGPNSFAGWHSHEDEMDLVLIDIEREKKGFIPPREFIKKYEHLHIPDVIYEGNYNKEFVNSVRNNDFNLKEGVVCKGVNTKSKRHDNIWMCKVKTNEWLNRVKNTLGQERLKEELDGDLELIK
jgi:hypothetical protein